MAYKVKPPKCGCEFWRRERRVKRTPNEEIIVLKMEMAEIREIMSTIKSTRAEHSEKVRELGLIMSGHQANIKSLASVTSVSKEQKLAVRSAERKYRTTSDTNYKLSMSLYFLSRLHNQMHMRCLEIRREQRENRTTSC